MLPTLPLRIQKLSLGRDREVLCLSLGQSERGARVASGHDLAERDERAAHLWVVLGCVSAVPAAVVNHPKFYYYAVVQNTAILLQYSGTE